MQILTVLAVLAALTLPVKHLRAQAAAAAMRDSARIDSLFQANRYAIELRDGRLVGPGAAVLAEATRRAQFIMVGESHYVGEIPQFTAAWFDELHRTRGVDYYAIEYGPTVGRVLSAAPVRGDTAAILRYAARYPHAFQFLNDEELEAMAHIGRKAPARDAIWGLDNEWGALHLLDRLVAIAPTEAARRHATALATRARPIETGRAEANVKRFITEMDTLAVDQLRAVYGAVNGTEAGELIDALEFSNRVYTLNVAAGRGELTGYQSNLDREQYQKAQFMAHYRAAQRAGDSLPRVLLKFGSLHGGKWRGFTNVHTLGNFIHEFATANGTESFHLVAWPMNEPGNYWSIGAEEGYGPIGRVGSTRDWVLVDFRPMRAHAHAGRMRGLSPALREAIFAHDAALLIGGGTRGTYEELIEAQRIQRSGKGAP